jgi:hypothetical protein
VTVAPFFNRLGGLSEDEDVIRYRLESRLSRAKEKNIRQEVYYEGSKVVRDLGIAIPPSLRDLEAVAGWPEVVVDVIDERLSWGGWFSAQDLGLEAVYTDNLLNVEVGQTFLDSSINGISFMLVGTGDSAAGEPDVLVTAENPSRVTGTWSNRLRRLTDALIETYDDDGNLTGWQLYLPDETITVSRTPDNIGNYRVTNRDQHMRNRVPVIAFRNRPRTTRPYGRSEITRAIRSLTDSGMRTLLGFEVAREFYAAPQRWLMGADESMFVDQHGNKRSQWDAVIGHMLAIPRDEDGELPTPGQFTAMSPGPFTEQLRTYSQMISASSGVPASHLGFGTDNPASADAIRESNSRLDRRTVRRSQDFTQGTQELAYVILLWRDGVAPDPRSFQSLWGDPSTPTPAAAADRTVKLVSIGVLPVDSDVTLEGLGFSETDIARLAVDRRRAEAKAALAAIAASASALPSASEATTGATSAQNLPAAPAGQ